MEKVSICNKKGSNCRISLENGIMNSNWVRIEINKFLKKAFQQKTDTLWGQRERIDNNHLPRKCMEQENGKGLSKQLTQY